ARLSRKPGCPTSWLTTRQKAIRDRSPPAAPLWRAISGRRNPVRPSKFNPRQRDVKGKTMKQRLQFFAKAPEIMKAVSALNKAVDECGLEVGLLHLIKLRASQINGC